MGTGYLRVSATTGDGALPIGGAQVKVLTKSGEILYEATTDENGNTQSFPLSAPDASLTLDPNYQKPAYSVVNVVVSAPGFITKHIEGAQIIDTQTLLLPVDLRPKNGIETDDYIYVPPLGVLTRNEEEQLGEPDPVIESRVLSQIVIPDYITVHLGVPSNASAPNVKVKFADYIKNVVSHEIYSTWPYNSLVANAHAITTFALNRIFTEWYRSRGYNFDITDNTNYDQNYVHGGGYYANISQIVDGIFNVYAHRFGFRNPFFTSFCAGTSGACAHGGMPQWGTVPLANQGLSPLEIMRRFYPQDLQLSESFNITGIVESFPGAPLSLGSSGEPVRKMQNFLNRIRVNYPLIPRIENPNGQFGADTAQAVRVFQSTFGLTSDGVIGRSTWNKITSMFVAITKLAELNSEGIRISIGQNPPNTVLSMGSRGNDVLELQFILNTIAAYYSEIPMVIQDGVFDSRIRNAVIEFQRTFGLPQDGVVGPTTWNRLYAVYRGIEENVTVPPSPPLQPDASLPPYPGTPLQIGSTGENVRSIQEFLNIIRIIYPNIPQITADGIFGTATQQAVIAFQRQFMLTPDGIIGPTTWNKIIEQVQIATGSPSTPLPSPEYFFYTVLPGDSLWLISNKFDTTVEAIMELNDMTSSNLSVGQVLRIPGEESTQPSYFEYTVRAGDSLWSIAQRFGTTVEAIMELNGLTNSNLSIGQILRIPGESSQPSYFEYTVRAGDSLWSIAQRFGTTVTAIAALNNLMTNNLSVGQILRIPA